jgi:DNA-binding response OmpR family regulator
LSIIQENNTLWLSCELETSKTILHNSNCFATALALAGHEPGCFELGTQLLHAIGNKDFVLLILDWNLPEVSGIEVLRQVRRGSKVPVILCTGRVSRHRSHR